MDGRDGGDVVAVPVGAVSVLAVVLLEAMVSVL